MCVVHSFTIWVLPNGVYSTHIGYTHALVYGVVAHTQGECTIDCLQSDTEYVSSGYLTGGWIQTMRVVLPLALRNIFLPVFVVPRSICFILLESESSTCRSGRC